MISIVTPVFNGEKYIEKCIFAVIKQNHQNIEHIIVDGDSSDNTVDIIKYFANKYSHIRWISESDKGQSDAMNKGINLANGEIIGILNVDDFYEPNIFYRINETIKLLPEPSLLVGNCNIIDDKGKIDKVNKPKNLNLVDLITLRHPFPLNPSAYFYHKSLHELIGLYNVDEHYMMDLEFIIKAVQHANITYIDETWGNHRHINGTKTVDLKNKGLHSKYLLNFLDRQCKQLPFKIKYQLLAIQTIKKIKFFIKNPKKIYIALKNKVS